MIVVQAETLAAADLFGMIPDDRNLPSFLDEQAIAGFLNTQNETDGVIESFSFSVPDIGYLARKLAPGLPYRMRFSDLSGAASAGRFWLYA